MEFASSAVTVTRLVKEPLPVANITSPWPRPRLTNTPPFAPGAPGWMCDAVKAVPAGNPCTETIASSVAAVIVPAASLVRLNVSVAVPEPLASSPLTGGTSLDARNAAVNVTDDAGEGVVGIPLSEPQAAARTPSA